MAAPWPPAFKTIADAVQANSLDAALAMLGEGFDVNGHDAEGNTALHWACWFKFDDLVARLLQLGARPGLRNASGETPAHWAAKASNVTSLAAVSRGRPALLSVRDCDGFTPFIICAQIDNGPLMEWMYLAGVSIEEQDDWGRTALQWACYKGHRRTVQWLLSRSASVVHRDYEGMSALHWAALKGHDSVAEMLLKVGAVGLLSSADTSGDTPISLAMRKKNRYLVFSFHKCQLLQCIIGRPFFSRNNFANLFVFFMLLNCVVFAGCLAPSVVGNHFSAAICWSASALGTAILWQTSCQADPGWLRPRTIFSQDVGSSVGCDPARDFDVELPIESQLACCDEALFDSYDRPVPSEVRAEDFSEAVELDLARLEIRQGRLGFQRQLVQKARRRLDDDLTSGPVCCVPGIQGSPSRRELQASVVEVEPLMVSLSGSSTRRTPRTPPVQRSQLDEADARLEERELELLRKVSEARVQSLRDSGGEEYMELLDRGHFKKICVVCRATRRMRSHHCKECGRCVDRLDHHCPWIDNCVGLGNQRLFYGFLVLLLLTILVFYYVVWLYVRDSLLPDASRASTHDVFHALTKGNIAPKLEPITVLCVAICDIIWLIFVTALLARHTAYIIANITTYEVLVRPAHVRRRFPKAKGRLWFFGGLGPSACLRHCLQYWTPSMDSDHLDFAELGHSAENDMSQAINGDGQDENESYVEPL